MLTVRLAQPAEAAHAINTSEVVNNRTEKIIRARFAIMAQREDMSLVTPRHRLDEREQCRNNALPTAAIDAAADDQADAQTDEMLRLD
jgi:hypothetical protein